MSVPLLLTAQLEAVLRSAPVGIAYMDREQRFIFVNDELAAINGVPAAETIGRTVSEVLPALAPTLQPIVNRVLQSGEPVRGIGIQGETSARAGELRTWEASYHPVHGPDGAPEGVIAVVQETTTARREARERERLQRLVEVSSDYVILTVPMGNVVYLNAAGRRLAGLAPDEDVTQRSMLDLVHPQQRARLEAEVVPALAADRVWEGIFPIRNAETGETINLDWSAFFVDDAEYGALLGGVGRDQNARRAAEARALEVSQALETLFELSPVPIFIMDLERNILRVNSATTAVFGWAEHELVGRTPPLESEASAEIREARRALRDGRVVSQSAAVRRKDGSVVRVVAYASPQLDASGAHVGSIGFLFDVEELEGARERAERVSRQQGAVAELSVLALSEASVQTVLDRATALLADRLTVEYAAVLELLPGEHELRLASGVGWNDGLVGVATLDVRAGSLAGYTFELDGPVVVEDLSTDERFTSSPILEAHGVTSAISTVIEEEKGRPWGVLGALASERCQFSEDDVNYLRSIANVIAAAVRRERTTSELRALATELEARVEARTRDAETAREDAQRASSAKTEFLLRMSHELRTPLNAIVGFAQLLVMDEVDRDTRESVDQILAAGLHLVGLIDELLDVSQIETGAVELELAPVDVAELTDEVVALVAPLAAKRGIGIRIEGPAVAGVTALADRRRLRQVLLNLLSNAIKYNRDGGSVEIELAAGGERASIAVRDTGLGIAAPEIARIFEPFHRVPGGPRVEGTGLGLTVSRGLVEAMGGTIRVESTPGEGSVFTADLPTASSTTAETP